MNFKKLFILLALISISWLSVLSDSALAQGSWTRDAQRTPLYPGEQIRFTGAVDSVGTLYSKAFNLRKYDGVHWGVAQDAVASSATAPGYWNALRFPFKVRYQATSVLGSPKLSAYVQANFALDSTDANWANVDTLFTDLTAETVADIDVDLNDKKYPWYRLKIVGVALGRSDQAIDIKKYCYQND